MFRSTKWFLVFTWFISTAVFAHPGHDHQHWSSSIIHGIFYLSILIVLFVAGVFVAKLIDTHKQNKGK
ncbi:hypothetical protein [Marinomonas balearica]|uniref:Uncharacterized protein n=1 Tax=Marinomonas balearica TaxID=491947 RepID=A0A4R6MD83_9GAMM|nr:hypothetical protein [Marinomonas balearica]TDO98670.1 hypothetical protein DFP79_1082 [Marinomonas balearica]